MAPTEYPGVIKASETLGEKVERLIKTVKISGRQIFLMKVALTVLGFLVVGLVISLIWLWNVAQDAEDATDAVIASQKVNCENANESRRSQVIIWDFILSASGRNDDNEPPPSPEEAAFRAAFQEWVHQLYAERDCENLTKKYELPPPPSIPGQTEEKS